MHYALSIFFYNHKKLGYSHRISILFELTTRGEGILQQVDDDYYNKQKHLCFKL